MSGPSVFATATPQYQPKAIPSAFDVYMTQAYGGSPDGIILPGQAPAYVTNAAHESYGFNYSPYDLEDHNNRLEKFNTNDDWHIINRDNQELRANDLKYTSYTVPGETAPRQVLQGMIPALDAFYAGRISQDQLEAAAANLTPTKYIGEPSIAGAIFKAAIWAVISWAAGQSLGSLINAGLGVASTATGGGLISTGSMFATAEGVASTGFLVDVLKIGTSIYNDVKDFDPDPNLDPYEPGNFEPIAEEPSVTTDADWWEDLGYEKGPQGQLDAREDGWRKEDNSDPTWDRNNIYGDGLHRARAYRDPITGEMRSIDDPTDSVFRNDELDISGVPPIITPPTEPGTEEEPGRGEVVPNWDDEITEAEDPISVFIPPIITTPATEPVAEEPDPWEEFEEQQRLDRERRTANKGGIVNLGITGDPLRYRAGVSGYAGGEAGRSVFIGPGQYNNPATIGILNRTRTGV